MSLEYAGDIRDMMRSEDIKDFDLAVAILFGKNMEFDEIFEVCKKNLVASNYLPAIADSKKNYNSIFRIEWNNHLRDDLRVSIK